MLLCSSFWRLSRCRRDGFGRGLGALEEVLVLFPLHLMLEQSLHRLYLHNWSRHRLRLRHHWSCHNLLAGNLLHLIEPTCTYTHHTRISDYNENVLAENKILNNIILLLLLRTKSLYVCSTSPYIVIIVCSKLGSFQRRCVIRSLLYRGMVEMGMGMEIGMEMADGDGRWNMIESY